MKRLLALLLVLCMMVGLLACGKKPADNVEGTGDNKETTEESKETTPIRDDITDIKDEDLMIEAGDDNKNDAYINPEKFAGKTLQIAGMNSDSFADLDNMGKGNYNWMMRAAIDEWATLNQVTVTYDCSASSTDILSAINNGTKLDLQFGSNETPGLANLGITKGFTQEQYDQIAKICGEGFVKMMMYKGESHGVVYPWTGNHMYYWNDTMFEQYGAKTPAQYLMEDNWNWKSMEQSWEAVTRDFNGNGKLDDKDTYGMGGTSQHLTRYIKYQEDPQTGKLTGTIGGQYYKDFYEMTYKAKYQTLAHSLKGTNYCTTTSTPRALAQVGDCEWYNFEHQYRVLENGDIIKATVLPAYNDGVTVINFTTRFMSILSSCDEPEAAFSLICYILKVGMRYIADYSVGLYKCEYEGIRGASEWSKGWKEKFEQVCEDRRAAFAELEDWDVEHYEKMVKKMFADDTIFNPVKKYANEVQKVSTANMPYASAIPLLIAEQDAWIAKYNELYAN